MTTAILRPCRRSLALARVEPARTLEPQPGAGLGWPARNGSRGPAIERGEEPVAGRVQGPAAVARKEATNGRVMFRQ